MLDYCIGHQNICYYFYLLSFLKLKSKNCLNTKMLEQKVNQVQIYNNFPIDYVYGFKCSKIY